MVGGHSDEEGEEGRWQGEKGAMMAALGRHVVILLDYTGSCGRVQTSPSMMMMLMLMMMMIIRMMMMM
eukprot:3465131-Amphidinium_carterae.1